MADQEWNMNEGTLAEAVRLGAAVTRFATVDGVTVAVLPAGMGEWRTEIVDVGAHLPAPRRAVGAFSMRSVDSFIEYVQRHKADGAVAWAHEDGRIDAVLNDHEGSGGAAGWRDHTAHLARVKTPSYIAWTSTNRKQLTQAQFADFIEERLGDIVAPDGADLMEIATFFQASTKVGFTSGRNLANGSVQLQYTEDIEERAGRAGNLTVPTEFTVLLRPYRDSVEDDAGQFVVKARLRWRLHDQKVTFWFALSEELDAFMDGIHAAAVERVRAETGIPVLLSA